MHDEGHRPLPSAARQLRQSGGGDEPRGRGLVHLVALVLAIPAAVALVWHDGAGGGVLVYAAALVGLYLVSACYHLISWSPVARRRWRQLDYSMIYIFIAASMTPYCLLGVTGTLSNVVLGIGWAAALLATLSLVLFFDATRKVLSSGYLVLGWLMVVTFPAAFEQLSAGQLTLLGAVALVYTVGAGVLAARWPDPSPEVFGYHEVWHAMVVVASACYFALVWTFPPSPR